MPDIHAVLPLTVTQDVVRAVLPNGNGALDTALLQNPRWNAPGPVGTAVAVTYYFSDSPPIYPLTVNGYTPASAAAWTGAQTDAITQVLAAYSRVANISFIPAASQSSADISLFLSTSLTASGFAFYPGSTSARGTSFGDVFLQTNSFPTDGSNLYLAFHEIGHALGLAHPFDGGTKPTIESFGFSGSRLFSVVDQRLTPQPYYLNGNGVGAIFNPSGPMLLDVLALQLLYGANTSTRNGDDVYRFDDNPNFYQTLWDGGGHDTIDVSNQTNPSLISLVEGTYSTAGFRDPFAGFPDWLTSWAAQQHDLDGKWNSGRNSLAIAFGAVIEDVIGSSAGDVLIGNAAANSLRGNRGDDLLDGGSGVDEAIFAGSVGTYTIHKAGAVTTVSGPDGTDTLTRIERLQFDDALVRLSSNAARDVDGDGKSDMLWRDGDGTVVEWRMNGLQIAGNYAVGQVPTTWRPVDAHGDYNGDGSSDVLWRNSDGAVSVWQMGGAGITAAAPVGIVAIQWAIVGGHSDFNGDGHSDVLWRDQGSGTVSLWQMSGTSIEAAADVAVVPMSYSIIDAQSDFNGDGNSDILWRDSNGAVAIWQMHGLRVASSRDFGIVAPGWAIVDGHADFNGDGSSDVLWRGADGSVSVWQMNGLQIVASRDFGIVANTWTILDAHGDYDGDGRSDLLWRNSDGMVSAWLMNGLNIAAARDFGVVAPEWTILDGHADFDGDGKSDVLWRGPDGMVSAWLMNGLSIAAARDFGVVPTSWLLPDAMEAGALLNGDGGSDTLLGTLNRDTLSGKGGNDTLAGGAGGDRFVFDTALDPGTNVATITDFTAGADKLVLSQVIFAKLGAGSLSAGSFAAGPSPTAQGANDFLLYDTTSGQLSYDSDGSGPAGALVFALLANQPRLSAADIDVGPA